MRSKLSIAEAVSGLAGAFSGRLLQPGDGGYDEARRVHNGMVDKRPALIAQCCGTADVCEAVNLARKLGLEVAVRGGGHNVAGRATVEGGVMIDLARMKGIYVDASHRTARAQGGVTWAELNRETQRYGLAVTGGVVSSTGIAGLTLAVVLAGLWASMVLPSTTLWRSSWSVPREKRCAPARRKNPTCFGPFAVAAATSVFRPALNISCTQ